MKLINYDTLSEDLMSFLRRTNLDAYLSGDREHRATWSDAMLIMEEAPEITEDELKAYANEKGYKLIKKQPYIKLEKCPFCGHLPQLWTGNHGYRYECLRQDHVERIVASEWTKSMKAARLSWNDMCNKEKENQNANMG